MARTSQRRPSVREVEHEGVRWIDVEEPTAATVRKVLAGLDVHPLDVEDILSPAQRPKLERRHGYLFAVVRFGRVSSNRRIRASELDAVLFDRTLVTFHGREMPLVRDALSDANLFAAKRRALLGQGPDYILYELLRRTFEHGFAATDQVSRQLDQLESDIYERHSRKTTFDVAAVRRTITDLRKVALPQVGFLRELGATVVSVAGPTTQAYWRSLRQLAESQWEQLEGFRETIESLADTNATLVSNRLNETFRLLTIISVIFLPATFLTQLFAVSVPGIPFQDLEFGFALVIGVLLLAELGFIWVLRRLKVL
ncbi:MAG: magnesium transporter CorA family protein [Candidatus Andersenbacteria bacterium]